jgi:hypothetical protein
MIKEGGKPPDKYLATQTVSLSPERREEVRREHVVALNELLHNYSAEIPNRIVDSRDGQYKVRTGWFAAIEIRLTNLVGVGLIAEKIGQEWISRLRSNMLKEPRTAKEIEAVDEILKEAITELQNAG